MSLRPNCSQAAPGAGPLGEAPLKRRPRHALSSWPPAAELRPLALQRRPQRPSELRQPLPASRLQGANKGRRSLYGRGLRRGARELARARPLRLRRRRGRRERVRRLHRCGGGGRLLGGLQRLLGVVGAFGQALGQLLGLGGRHLGQDGGQRGVLHLGGDGDADLVVQRRHHGGSVARLHLLVDLDQAVDVGLLLAAGCADQRLDLRLHVGDRLQLGVDLGLGGGEELELGVERLLPVVELAAPVLQVLQRLQFARRDAGLLGEVGRRFGAGRGRLRRGRLAG